MGGPNLNGSFSSIHQSFFLHPRMSFLRWRQIGKPRGLKPAFRISKRTVEGHINNIYVKTGTSIRRELMEL
ncbi:MAG: hypothetical protein FWD88_02460 [Treponema sp.]|nr:hypothetical protein [Treponema sp.]